AARHAGRPRALAPPLPRRRRRRARRRRRGAGRGAAALLRPRRPARALPGLRHRRARPEALLRPPRQLGHPPHRHRLPVGGRPGLARHRPLSRLLRHPQRRVPARGGGGHVRPPPLPQPRRLLQRQHLRPRGPPDRVPPLPPRRAALRARRQADGARRPRPRRPVQRPQRRRGPPGGRRALVHRPRLRRADGLRRPAPARSGVEPAPAHQGSDLPAGRADRPSGEGRRRAVQAQRPLLLPRLPPPLRRRHRQIALRAGQEHHLAVGRGRPPPPQPSALRRHDPRREKRLRRRHPLRRERQHLGRRRLGRRGLRRRPRFRPRRRPHRPDPPAGDLLQRLLRRHAAEPALHDGEPVALRGAGGDARGALLL
ncbi:MAG: Gluconolactonase, partial [uncultured Acetobacteraceae bacterium]